VIAKTYLHVSSCLKISKFFVAYLKDLLALAQYLRCTADPSAAGFVKEVVGEAFNQLNMVKK
jgi:hypothetical protein